MQKLEGGAGPAGGLLAGAAVTGGTHGEVQGLGNAQVVRVGPPPLDHLAAEVVGGRLQGCDGAPLPDGGGFLGLGQEGGIRKRRVRVGGRLVLGLEAS